ncbi:hypothetical protein [Gulosibacter bifidus]|uniref:Uncharacterized protein n=1 Tax=Gulosibacter bifidus TaxID=272239 RepID=A0ABW5RHQ1_9MICO|nr:hypothetical protein [Gulosibacter bifidus]
MAEHAVESGGDMLFSAKTNFAGNGQAADALRGIIGRYLTHTDNVEARLTDFLLALNRAAEAVEQLATDVASTQALIDANRFVVDGSDKVQIPDWVLAELQDAVEESGKNSPFVPDPVSVAYGVRAMLQGELDGLLQRAETIARELSSNCDAIRDGDTSQVADLTASSQGSGFDYQSLIAEFETSSAAEVSALWDSLDHFDQQHLKANYPEIIGNLSGVPLVIRKQANDANLQIYLDKSESEQPSAEIESRIKELEKSQNDGPLSSKEQSELDELQKELERRAAARDMLNGDGAITFSPEESRVVAVVGDLADTPDYLITHVPGTGTEMSSFADGGVRELPSDIVDALERQGKGAVAFVVKDGPWASWVGENSNSLHSAMERMGQSVYRLDEDLRIEDFAGDPREVGIVYSAGMSINSAAEVQGAHYDEVISLAGSYMVSSWESDATTEYTHVQYEADAINAVDRSKWHRTPNESLAFDKVILGSEGRDGIDGHNRIAQGKESNPEGLRAIMRELND